ncbi:hypothetical protein GCM10010365_07130 [Streptomyces poonensis]|uniref:Uncharacterized protein n=1 Tax=Streptomyces poonensis TaxID=68255 RepID=A0A918UCX1_9ACTN|nr:hypothetical protein GCM10010365_07130 [Streptomyces poonensis]GLJ87850.1 hypothetical protein GCM10017589_04500 [Streptomyces poonensis]
MCLSLMGTERSAPDGPPGEGKGRPRPVGRNTPLPVTGRHGNVSLPWSEAGGVVTVTGIRRRVRAGYRAVTRPGWPIVGPFWFA